MLNKLRKGNHTTEDLLELKERLTREHSLSYSSDAPHLFIQNAKVNNLNMEVHNASDNEKYNIKAQDSVIGTNSLQVKKKNLNQIPSDPRKQNSYFLCVKENLIIFDESFSKMFHGGLKDLKKKPRLIKHKCHEIGVEHDRFLAALYSVYITKVEGFAESVESFYFRPHRKGTFEYEKSAVGLCTLNKILPEKFALRQTCLGKLLTVCELLALLDCSSTMWKTS